MTDRQTVRQTSLKPSNSLSLSILPSAMFIITAVQLRLLRYPADLTSSLSMMIERFIRTLQHGIQILLSVFPSTRRPSSPTTFMLDKKQFQVWRGTRAWASSAFFQLPGNQGKEHLEWGTRTYEEGKSFPNRLLLLLTQAWSPLRPHYHLLFTFRIFNSFPWLRLLPPPPPCIIIFTLAAPHKGDPTWNEL